jgi:Ca-activated chloride channel family protein
MPADRTAARRAWALSLTLHGAVLAGLLALPHRPPGPVGMVSIDTRAGDAMAVGLILLDDPAPRPPAAPSPLPPVPAEPLPVPVAWVPPPPPLPPPITEAAPAPAEPVATAAIQPVAHREQANSGVARHPAANAAGSPGSAPVLRPAAELPPGTATAFFGVPAVGKSVVFVIDRSASMGLANRLDRAKRELFASLRLLPPSARFQVIAYHRAAEPLRLGDRDGLLPATPDTVAAALAALAGLSAEGGTDHTQALRAALTLQPDVIYFLTDEDELTSADVQRVSRLNRGRVCIHALCLVPPAGAETPMRELARGNRGVFRVVSSE